nr:NAD(P)-dependent oxidoreductase [Rhodoplanes elegans]
MCPDLRLVVSQGIGLETFDLAEARRRGIAVAHTPDEIAEDVGDAAIAMIYAVLRGTLRADAFVRAGRWGKERIAATRRVAGRTVGIVGLGRIGRHVADRATAIGMRVLYHTRRRAEAPYEWMADVVTLATRSDVLVLACPGGEATRHLVDATVLDALGPDGVLVNVARGSVVDEAALLDALEGGRIHGAALDVFATEPAIDPRFLALDNVVLSPHSASITRETRAAIIARMIDDIDAYRNGRPFFDAAAAP